MAKITYDNKVALNENQEIADINKVTDADMNMLKSVINENDDDFTQLKIQVENLTDVYSLEETKTNKVWVDGKPIYRKVITKTFELPQKTNVTAYTIPHGIENIDLPISCHHVDTFGVIFTFIAYSRGLSSLVRFDATNIEIRYYNDSFSSRPHYFICEYTKTTDTATVTE